MPENLNPATEPERVNADWIRPGRASWDYLAGDRDKPKTWIDFDVDMGWEYHLVDAGFERRFDVPEATKYAQEKGIYRDGTTKTDLVIEDKKVASQDTLVLPMLQNGGFAVYLKPVK